MNHIFTEDEWQKMKRMTMAIWGVDLEVMRYWQARSTNDKIEIGYVEGQELNPKWWNDDTIMSPSLMPEFKYETIEFDRWLIPWKVKAGYSERLNILVYRVEQ